MLNPERRATSPMVSGVAPPATPDLSADREATTAAAAAVTAGGARWARERQRWELPRRTFRARLDCRGLALSLHRQLRSDLDSNLA